MSKLLVNAVFDTIGVLSAFAGSIVGRLVGTNSDLIAFCIMSAAVGVMVLCRDYFSGTISKLRCVLWLLVGLGFLVVLASMACAPILFLAVVSLLGGGWLVAGLLRRLPKRLRLRCQGVVITVPFVVILGVLAVPSWHHEVIPLGRKGLKPESGLAWRHRFAAILPPAEAERPWKLVATDHSWLAPWKLLMARTDREVHMIQQVRDEGGGLFRLRDDRIWLSTPDGSSPLMDQRRFYLVREHAWFAALHSVPCRSLEQLQQPQSAAGGIIGKAVAALVFWLTLAGSVLLWCVALRRFWPPLLQAASWLVGQHGLLLIGGAFLLLYGAHQVRFLPQDHRMQVVTSHDDDGYMLERLSKARELQTMDPWRTGNAAYGAIAYYPYAVLPFVSGTLGWSLPLEWLNAWVRGLKTLASAGLLAAVWWLGARHFGKVAAVAATLLMATSFGFLRYSSFPFYPDVAMTACFIMALVFMLDLVGGWSGRAFFFAVLFAALSVSIKFFTALLMPLLALVAAWAVLRDQRWQWRPAAKLLMPHFAAAGLLSVAVFFFCNPYTEYNSLWIVPNYKAVTNMYSIASSVIVTSQAATLADWRAAYEYVGDRTELVALIVTVLATPGMLLLWWTGSALAGRWVLLVSVAAAFQGYLCATVTLPLFIDYRFIMPVVPILFVASAWVVARLFTMAAARGRTWMLTALAGLLLMLPPMVRPRWTNVNDFATHFGVMPSRSEVNEWLDAAKVPETSTVVTALQSYIRPERKKVLDGYWRPSSLEEALFQCGDLPPVFIEGDYYFTNFFSPLIGGRGFNTAEQSRLFKEGVDYYGRFRANRLFPYVRVSTGSECIATNLLSHAIWEYRMYANPFAFAEDLVARGHPAADVMDFSAKPMEQEKLFTVDWGQPTTVSLVHLTTMAVDAPACRVELDGSVVGMLAPGSVLGGQATERFLQLDPPREASRLVITRADGIPLDGAQVRRIGAYAPVPSGLNPIQHYFELVAGAGMSSGDWQKVSSLLFQEGGEVPLRAARQHRLLLRPRFPFVLRRLKLVFEATASAPALRADCRLIDGSSVELADAMRQTQNPAWSYFILNCAAEQQLAELECILTPTAGGAFVLRQIAVDAEPLPP